MHEFNESITALAEPIPPGTGERVVVFRYDKIGDLLVTTPLFRAIKENRPDAYATLVCSPYNRAVLENMPQIDRIVPYDVKAGWRDKLRFALALRRLKPDTVFVMSPDPGGYWMGLFSGAKRRAGLVMTYRTLLVLLAPLLLTTREIINRKPLDAVVDRTRHHSEVALRLAARSGFPRPAVVAQSAPASPAARDWVVRNTFGPALPPVRILLHLGVTWRSCGLPEESMSALVAGILAKFPGVTLLMTAGPADLSFLAALSSDFPQIIARDPLIQASPQLYPRALLLSALDISRWSALIESTALVVTPDTGAVHFASAHQRPVVAVYTAARFNSMTSLFGPWETPYRTLQGGKPAAELISDILAAMGDLLDKR